MGGDGPQQTSRQILQNLWLAFVNLALANPALANLALATYHCAEIAVASIWVQVQVQARVPEEISCERDRWVMRQITHRSLRRSRVTNEMESSSSFC